MKIYFSGISGVAIGPLAMLADDAGYAVCGSDLNRSSYFDELEKRGITTYDGQDGSQIESEHKQSPIDWFVMTAALPDDHPELTYARENGIRVSKRDELINQIIKDKDLKLIAISGTHGKTTTTSMLIWLFKQHNIPVSYSVGTTLSFGPSAGFNDGSEYFIYEADEFDRNFLKFNPYASIVTTLDFDHPDTYADQGAYDQAFADFLEATETFKNIWSIDSEKLPDYIADDCIVADKSDARIKSIMIPGAHNRENAFLAAEMFMQIFNQQNEAEVYQTLASFPGSTRRFEEIIENLYTDYAHHPSEIKAMIKMAQELSENIVVIYQPHQNKRQEEIMLNGGYKDVFVGASKVFWLPTFISREASENAISSQTLVDSTTNPEDIHYSKMNSELHANIREELSNQALVIAMSAGDLDSWIRDQFLDS